MTAAEVNFDGLIGPTHNYAGLSYGNLASSKNRNLQSSPRQAALQGLEKMLLNHRLGIEQAILPPHPRPDFGFLRSAGFNGSDSDLLQQAGQTDPVLLAAAWSAAAMWTANAATVSPAADSLTDRVQITPANLTSGVHRSLEADHTEKLLRAIFPASHFDVHAPLPRSSTFADEGAANHMRLSPSHETAAIEVFVFGRDALATNQSLPGRFPARQTMQAFQAIARRHRLKADRTLFLQQNPKAIDQGAFHNDVVAVANENVLFCHQDSFLNQADSIEKLSDVYQSLFADRPVIYQVDRDDVSLEAAVSSYLFNSQLVTLPNTEMALIAPTEARDHPQTKIAIDRLLAADNPVQHVYFPDVRQSMRNGGGPACLRLRVVLNEYELQAMHQGVRFSDQLYFQLKQWVQRHYRTQLSTDDLISIELANEVHAALIELESILDFPAGLLSCNFESNVA